MNDEGKRQLRTHHVLQLAFGVLPARMRGVGVRERGLYNVVSKKRGEFVRLGGRRRITHYSLRRRGLGPSCQSAAR